MVLKNAHVAIAIGVMGSALFLGSLGHGFVMDDISLIKNNPLTQGFDQLPEIFRTDYWHPTIASGLYRPLVKASYVLNWELGGLDPSGFHLLNVLLHGLVCALVFLLLIRVTGNRILAAAAGLLFAVHAVHTEVVVNVASGRPETLAAAFSLLSALAYLSIRPEDSARRRWLKLGSSMLALFLATLSKESAITILAVIGLYDVCYRTDETQPLWSRVWLALKERALPYYLPLCSVVAGYLLFRSLALSGEMVAPPHISLDNPIVGLDQPWRLVNALYVSFRYVWLLVFPRILSYDYSYNAIPMITAVDDPRLWLTLALVLASAAGTALAYRRSRNAFFAICFFLLTFSVVSNVFVLIGTVLGERLLYFPSIGFCLLAAVALRALAQRIGGEHQGRAVLAGLLAVVLGLHGWRAIDRTADWVDEYTLYTTDAETVPESTKAQNNAGAIRIGRHEYEQGLAQLQRAIDISPLGYHIPYYSRGLALTTLGRDEEAIAMYEGSLLNGDPDPVTRNNLGFILVDHEIDIPRGIALIEEAVESMPEIATFRDSLAWGYYKNGELERAREEMERAIEMPPPDEVPEEWRERLRLIENAIHLRAIATTPTTR